MANAANAVIDGDDLLEDNWQAGDDVLAQESARVRRPIVRL